MPHISSGRAGAVTAPRHLSGVSAPWSFRSAAWHLLAHLCSGRLVDITVFLLSFLNYLKIVFFVSLVFGTTSLSGTGARRFVVVENSSCKAKL